MNKSPLPPVANDGRTCETCKFRQSEFDNMQARMHCRRFPPQVSHLLVPTAQGPGIQLQCTFPLVAADAWCGEWLARMQG